MTAAHLGRRSFGLGLLVASLTLRRARPGWAATLPTSLKKTPRLDGWIRIAPGGTVIICTGKVELGQGILTALAQIAADGLDVDLARIRVVSGDTAETPDEGQTSGSYSVEQSGEAIRAACAEARALLVGAAAAKGGLPADRLAVVDGTIRDPATGWQLDYWALDAADLLHAMQPRPWPRNRRASTATSASPCPGWTSPAR